MNRIILSGFGDVPVYYQYKPSAIEKVIADKLGELGLSFGDSTQVHGDVQLEEDEEPAFGLDRGYLDYPGYERKADKEYRGVELSYIRGVEFDKPIPLERLWQDDDNTVQEFGFRRDSSSIVVLSNKPNEKALVWSWHEEDPLLRGMDEHLQQQFQQHRRKFLRGNFYDVPLPDLVIAGLDYLKQQE